MYQVGEEDRTQGDLACIVDPRHQPSEKKAQPWRRRRFELFNSTYSLKELLSACL
jgi:hypothetical protein